MKCSQVVSQLASYNDGDMPQMQQIRIESHLAKCPRCRDVLAEERHLCAALASLTVTPSTDDFEARVLARATRRSDSGNMRSGLVGSAIAASLALGIVLGAWWSESDSRGQGDFVQTVSAPNSGSQVVNLAFNAGKDLKGVTLTLELPGNTELAGFPGQRSLSWQIDLKPGQNLLALPLTISGEINGQLVAHLKADGNRKTFVARITAPGSEPTGGES